MIKGIDIHKSFGNKKILQGVNIQIQRGKVTVLQGPSGCGKSTLLRCLALLDEPNSGVIEIDSDSFKFPKSSNKKLLKPYPKVTVVYQQLFLWPHLTNRKNILLAVHQTDYKQKLNELIDFLSLENFLDQFPNESSLGQKQRIAIARALILNPQFVFFDEITSALDDYHTEELCKLIEKLQSEGLGVFIVTHDHRVVIFFREIEKSEFYEL